MAKKTFTLDLSNGTTLKVETGQLAPQANGAAVVTIGETVVLGTACMSRKPTDLDFLPLSVAYQEKLYASGLVAHSKVNKREGRPADDKILSARVIDRTLRPLFPKGFNHNLQTMLTILSYDNETMHDMVAGTAASVAFSISEAPFEGPTAMVRVGMIDGEFLVNPTVTQLESSKLDLIVSSTESNVVMIEAKANEVTEAEMFAAIQFGYEEGKKICQFISGIQKEIGKEKIEYTPREIDERILPAVEEKYTQVINETIFDGDLTKLDRFAKFDDLKEEAAETIGAALNEGVEDEEALVSAGDIKATFDKVMKGEIRKSILEKEQRIKGRKLDEVRELNCEVDLLPRTHGSALFNRGETQGLTITTLAGPEQALIKTGVEGERKQRYFHHYNFPPFSVGEVSTRLFTGNREIGHGALAEKALQPVLPTEEDFPYVIRTVTEILSSNGSSSMAAVCGSTLSLMAAGVPLKAPVAGVAMGLMTDGKGNHKVLTDLQDEEDFGGDMDFKVAGTKDGITVIQMDIKLKGIPMDIFEEALEHARVGRLKIMDAMLAAIPEPREKLSKYAPRMETVKIHVDKIRDLIGKGGETINRIIDETKVSIDIQDSGLVTVTGGPDTDMDRALQLIEEITAMPEVGKTYNGKVVKVTDFGAFVNIMPGTDGLVHVSKMAKERVNSPADVVKEGQEVKVKLLSIDDKGRLQLSMVDAE